MPTNCQRRLTVGAIPGRHSKCVPAAGRKGKPAGEQVPSGPPQGKGDDGATYYIIGAIDRQHATRQVTNLTFASQQIDRSATNQSCPDGA